MRRSLLFFSAIFYAAYAVAPHLACPDAKTQTSAAANESVPSAAEQHALIERVFANQHADDQALVFFERVEHFKSHGKDGDQGSVQDWVVRQVPMGVGLARITLEDHGRAMDQASILSQEATVEHQLELAADPNNPQTRRDREKAERHQHDRAELIDAAHDAFTFTWAGREERNGKMWAKFRLDPNPSYKSTSRWADMMSHASAVIWVDEQAAQVGHIEAQLNSDVTIGGGLLARVYKGGKVVMDQYEVEPGVWLPTFRQDDFSGRKVLFSSLEIHERTETTNYKRIGSPDQALAVIRRELSAGNTHGQQ
jgi:hypothetical protein